MAIFASILTPWICPCPEFSYGSVISEAEKVSETISSLKQLWMYTQAAHNLWIYKLDTESL